MNKLHISLFSFLMLGFFPIALGQDNYFFNQRNIFSVNASFNPRLIPMNQNGSFNDEMGASNAGIGRGTYFQGYNENNELVSDFQNFNLMLNTSYMRLYNANRIVGVEFNYQKHNLTMNENAVLEYKYDPFDADKDIEVPFEISTPVFNVYDVQFLWGVFSDATISPNKHLFTCGLGVRMFSLDQKQNYRFDEATPYTDLENYMEDYDKMYIFTRFSMNYTYRILITKNLSFDLGVNLNIGLYQDMEADGGLPMQSGYYSEENPIESPAYARYFVKNKLGHETFYNMIYFRSGLSFAL
ncbi:hypothetical protein [Brumimicrobium oceani]|nr:hypothetical protein [Brumimicrobium oceani]